MQKLLTKNYRMMTFVICGIHRKGYIYVCCFEGLQGPASAYIYRLLIYSPFHGTAKRLRNAYEMDLIKKTTACGRGLLYEQKYMQLLLPYAMHIQKRQNVHVNTYYKLALALPQLYNWSLSMLLWSDVLICNINLGEVM